MNRETSLGTGMDTFVPLLHKEQSAQAKGWVLFDSQCAFCRSWAYRMQCALRRRGFALASLQAYNTSKDFDLPAVNVGNEMKVLTRDGRVFSGAAAVIYLARRIWWAWPLFVLAQLPGMKTCLDRAYRWIAYHRYRLRPACRTNSMVSQN